MDKVFVTDQVISAADLAKLVSGDKSGAVVSFSGDVSILSKKNYQSGSTKYLQMAAISGLTSHEYIN